MHIYRSDLRSRSNYSSPSPSAHSSRHSTVPHRPVARQAVMWLPYGTATLSDQPLDAPRRKDSYCPLPDPAAFVVPGVAEPLAGALGVAAPALGPLGAGGAAGAPLPPAAAVDALEPPAAASAAAPAAAAFVFDALVPAVPAAGAAPAAPALAPGSLLCTPRIRARACSWA